MKIKPTSLFVPTRFVLAMAVSALGSSVTSQAQSIIASGQISGVAAGGGIYDYTMSVSEASGTTNSIGSFWYAWIPGQFYLPSVPSSAHAPTGWTASIVANSIQFIASSSAYYIAPGTSLGNFGFASTDTPAAINGNSPSYPGTPVGTTVAYAAGLFSAPEETFVFTPAAVPEPSSLALMALGTVGLLTARAKSSRRNR